MKTVASTLLLNLLLTGCVLDCADKKTGMPRFSETIDQSKKNQVFNRQLYPRPLTFTLDSGLVFQIRNAWIENEWKYECVNQLAEIAKDTTMQVVIDGDLQRDTLITDYWLGSDALGYNGIGGRLSYPYQGQDTIQLFMRRQEQIIDTLTLLPR